jgi:16S rRNA (adenine1518-N6/adenine1519-N6)-dimethyltransferase
MSNTHFVPRHTQRYLRELLEARGLRPNSKLGQCFLIDLNLVDLIVREAQLGPEDLVLEVGAGTGSLTLKLGEQAGAVLGAELDAGLFKLAQDFTQHLPNVKLLHADILASKNRLNPEVLRLLREGQVRGGFQRLKLVANLPYVVATPVIANLLLTDLPLERMVATVQWELAARLAAKPRAPDYGALSVFVQSVADVTILRKLPASAFWPRPKVESGIVRIVPSATKRAQVGDVAALREFLHHLYLHRRKNLRGALLTFLGARYTKPALDDHLARHDFDPQGRAEALCVAEHVRLWRSFRSPA